MTDGWTQQIVLKHGDMVAEKWDILKNVITFKQLNPMIYNMIDYI